MEFLYECQNRTGLIVPDIPISELSALDYKSLQKIEKICGEYPWIKAIQPSTKREISRIFSAVDVYKRQQLIAGKKLILTQQKNVLKSCKSVLL